MSDAHGVARDQLKAIVERVERLESEIKDLNDDKSDIYKEARANGFDVKAIKKVVSQRKLDTNEREEADLVFDTYWAAVHGVGLVHAHARENIEEFDAETGEVFQAKASGDNGATGQAAKVPADSVTGDVSRPSRGGDTPATNSNTDAAISRPELNRPEIANGSEEEGPEAGSSGGMQDERAIHPAAPIAPASHGEAEAPSADERQSPDDGLSGEGAHTGGSNVDAHPSFAAQAGSPFSSSRPAAYILRPDCRNPGETCGGHGSTLCHSCKVALREREEA